MEALPVWPSPSLWKSHPTSKAPITLWSWPVSPCHGLHFQLQCITWTILSNAIWAQNVIGKQRSRILKALEEQHGRSGLFTPLSPFFSNPFLICLSRPVSPNNHSEESNAELSLQGPVWWQLQALVPPFSPNKIHSGLWDLSPVWNSSSDYHRFQLPSLMWLFSSRSKKTKNICHLGGNMQIHNHKCLWIRITDVSYLYFFFKLSIFSMFELS